MKWKSFYIQESTYLATKQPTNFPVYFAGIQFNSITVLSSPCH